MKLTIPSHRINLKKALLLMILMATCTSQLILNKRLKTSGFWAPNALFICVLTKCDTRLEVEVESSFRRDESLQPATTSTAPPSDYVATEYIAVTPPTTSSQAHEAEVTPSQDLDQYQLVRDRERRNIRRPPHISNFNCYLVAYAFTVAQDLDSEGGHHTSLTLTVILLHTLSQKEMSLEVEVESSFWSDESLQPAATSTDLPPDYDATKDIADAPPITSS
ncbi:hypothetical protein V2J09_016584 [Rumex salicifolius]